MSQLDALHQHPIQAEENWHAQKGGDATRHRVDLLLLVQLHHGLLHLHLVVAVPLLEDAWKRGKDRFGPGDPDVRVILNNLADAYQKLGDAGRAVALCEEALKGFRETLPPGFQRSEYLLEKGMVDKVVARKDLPETLASILGTLTMGRAKATRPKAALRAVAAAK